MGAGVRNIARNFIKGDVNSLIPEFTGESYGLFQNKISQVFPDHYEDWFG